MQQFYNPKKQHLFSKGKNYLFIYFFLTFALTSPTLIFSQTIGEEPTLEESNSRYAKPTINLNNLRNQIAASATNTLDLPLPNSNVNFILTENNVLSKELQFAYPNLKTYDIKSADGKYTGKLTISDNQLYAIINTDEGTVIIRPFAEGEGIYESYFSDVESEIIEEQRDCGNTDATNKDFRNNNQQASGRGSGSGFSHGTTMRTYNVAVLTTDEFGAEHGANAMTVIANTIQAWNTIYNKDLAVNFVLNRVQINNSNTDGMNSANSRTTEAHNRIAAVFAAADYDIGHVFHYYADFTNPAASGGWGGGGLAGLGVVCNPNRKGAGWSGSFDNTSNGWFNLSAHEIGHMFGAEHTFNGTNDNCTNAIAATNAYEIASGNSIMSYNGICGNNDGFNLDGTANPDNFNYNITSGGVADHYFHTISLNQMITYIGGTGGTCGTTSGSNNVPVVNADPCSAGTVTIPKGTPFTLIGSATDGDGDALLYSWEQVDEDGAGSPTQGATLTRTGTNGQTAGNSTIAPLFRSFPPSATGNERTFPSTIDGSSTGTEFEVLPQVARTMNFSLTVKDGNGGVACTDRAITVTNTGPLVVGSPCTGGNLIPGSTIMLPITTNGSTCTTAKVYLSTDGGSTFPYDLGAINYSDGNQSVMLPAGVIATTEAKFKVICEDNPCAEFFQITASNCTITSSCVATASIVCPPTEVSAAAGSAATNLSLTQDYTNPFTTAVITESTVRQIVVNDMSNSGCFASSNSNGANLSFVVDVSGTYTISIDPNHSGFPFISLFSSTTTFDCTTFLGSTGNDTDDEVGGSVSTGTSSISATLSACDSYTILGWNFGASAISITSIAGAGNAYTMASAPPANYAYTYAAVSTVDNNVKAVSATSDFTSLTGGSYEIYGISYKASGGGTPADVDPTTFVGQTLTAIQNIDCALFSTNKKSLTLTGPVCATAGTGTSTSACVNSTATINLASLLTGASTEGTWSQIGSGGTFDAVAGTFVPNSAAAGTYTFRYTIAAAAPCPMDTEDVTVIVNALPSITTTAENPTTCGAIDGKIIIEGLETSTDYKLNYKKAGTAVAEADITSTGTGTYEITGLNAATYTEITVTETATGCVSNQETETLVDPTSPTVTKPDNQTVCAGTMTAAVIFAGTGTTYEWTNNNTAIELAASGTGNIAAFMTTNTTSSPITATITVTPKMGDCTGTSETFTITVDPLPMIASTKTDPTTCGESDGEITITGLKNSATYDLNYKNAGTLVTEENVTSTGTGTYEITGLNAAAYTEITMTEMATGCVSNQTTQTLADPSSPTVTKPSNQSVCAGDMTTAITFAGTGTTYDWTNDNPAIDLAASGTGDIAAFTATNTTTSAITATITVTPKMDACTGTAETFTITVNPLPSITTTIKSNPSTCGASDGEITIAGLTNLALYSLNYKKSGTAVPAVSFMATGTTYDITGLSAAAYTEITVTEMTTVTTSCVSNQEAETLVDPTSPTVTKPGNQTVCAGTMTAAVTFAGTGTTYEWTNDNTAIGLAASGTGNIAAFATTNTTSSPITATITVTPKMGDCTGTSETFTITVDPLPMIASTKTDPTTCGESDGKITITGLKNSATYDLNYKNAGTLVTEANITSTGTGTYEITGLNAAAYTEITMTETATGCVSNQTTQSLADPSSPTVTKPSNQAICVGGMTTAVTFAGTGTTYDWTNDNTAIGLAASGTGDIAAFTTTNTTTSAITATITVTPKMGACTGTAETFTITVNPLPSITTTKSDPTTCGASDGKIIIAGLKNSATYDLNYKKAGTAVTESAITSTGTYEITGLDAAAYTEITVTETATGCVSNQETETLVDPSGAMVATLSGTALICKGQSANLAVAITGGATPYTIVYSDGTSNTTVNSYTSGANIPVTPTSTATYNLVSVTDNNGCIGTGNTGTAVVTITEITAITVTNISACNNNGTPATITDDKFTADVAITFANPPSTGNLVLTGDGTGTIATSAVTGTTHTFTGVSMDANGEAIALTANFSALTGCTFNNTNAGMAPFQCSITFTDTTGTTGMAGAGGMMQMFMAEDPCSCVGDQVQNANGTVTTVGSFDETVTVRGPSGLNVQVALNAATRGLLKLDGSRTSINFPAAMTETVVGGMSDYTIDFRHLDGAGYNIAEFEFSTPAAPATFIPITTPTFDLITISNQCTYPKVSFSPALPSQMLLANAPITLGVNVAPMPLYSTAETVNGINYPLFTVNGDTVTTFDPSRNIGTNTIVGVYDFAAGSGEGGTSANPAKPLDKDMDATNGVCPVQIQSSILVTEEVIPTMSEWGLLIFGLLMLNLGLMLIFHYQEQLQG